MLRGLTLLVSAVWSMFRASERRSDGISRSVQGRVPIGHAAGAAGAFAGSLRGNGATAHDGELQAPEVRLKFEGFQVSLSVGLEPGGLAVEGWFPFALRQATGGRSHPFDRLDWLKIDGFHLFRCYTPFTRDTHLFFKKATLWFLGLPVVPFYPFLGEGSPTKIDYGEKGTLILTSLPEDLGKHWEGVSFVVYVAASYVTSEI